MRVCANTQISVLQQKGEYGVCQVVGQLVQGSASFISKRLMACLLLVDFCNPVYSARRLRLMDFVPVSGGGCRGPQRCGTLYASGQDTPPLLASSRAVLGITHLFAPLHEEELWASCVHLLAADAVCPYTVCPCPP